MSGPRPLAVPYELPRVQYALPASPPSTYAIAWQFWTLDQDLAVQVVTPDGVIHVLAYGSDFTVAGNAPADPNNSFYDGGTMTLLSPASWGMSTLTLWRLPDLHRDTNISPTGPLNVKTLNAQLDQETTIEQDLNLRLNSMYGRRYTELGNDMTVRYLPTPITGNVLGWNGQEIVNYNPAVFGGTQGPTGPTGAAGGVGTFNGRTGNVTLNQTDIIGAGGLAVGATGAQYQMVRYEANGSVVMPEAAPYDLCFSTPDTTVYTGNQVIVRHLPVHPLYWPAGLAGSRAGCVTAPAGAVAITLAKNGVGVGSINIAAGATSASLTLASATSFAVTDVLTIVGPASADASFAGLYASLLGIRQ